MYTREPPDRGETDAKQVQNTRQTGARTMTSNRKPLHSSRNAGPSVLGVSDGLFVYGLNETELETLKLRNICQVSRNGRKLVEHDWFWLLCFLHPMTHYTVSCHRMYYYVISITYYRLSGNVHSGNCGSSSSASCHPPHV